MKLHKTIEALGEILDLAVDWETSQGFDRFFVMVLSLSFFYGSIVFLKGYWRLPFLAIATLLGALGAIDYCLHFVGRWRRR